MDFVKNAVSYITFQRFYRYLLKRILGGFIVPDFTTDQLDIQVYRGEVQLVDAAIDSRKLNELLNQENLPFRVKGGIIGRIRIQIPWRNILHEKCKVFISGVELDLVIHRSDNIEGTAPHEPMSSPRNSTPNVPESARSLTRLVRQVLMNVEGCLENLTIRLVSHQSSVYLSYHISTVLLHQGGNKIKRFDLGPTSLIAHTQIDHYQLITSHPGTISLNIVDPQVVAINTNLSSFNITIDSPDSIKIINDLLSPSSNLSDDFDAFFPAIEPEPEIPSGPRRPWYEEMYSVLESEVLGEEAVTVSDLPELLIEEPIEFVDEREFIFNCNLSNFSLNLFSLNFQFQKVDLEFDPRDPSSLSATVDQYRIALIDVDDTVSVSSFNSAVDEEDQVDLENLLFTNKFPTDLLFPPPPLTPLHDHETVISESVADLKTMEIRIKNNYLEISISSKLLLNLNPSQIFEIQSLIDKIPRSTNSSDSAPFTIAFSDGIAARVNLGCGHWLQLDFNGSVIIDPRKADVVVVKNGMSVLCNEIDCPIISSRTVLVRFEDDSCLNVPSGPPEDIVDGDDEDHWTSLSIPSTSIMRQIFGNKKPSLPQPSASSSSPPRVRAEEPSQNDASTTAENIMRKCREKMSREVIIDFGEIEIAKNCSAIDFVHFQLKLQSFLDQLSDGKRSEQTNCFGISILAESINLGPFISLSQIGCRILLGSSSTTAGIISRNLTVSSLARSNNSRNEHERVRDRFEKNCEAVTVTIEILPITADSNRINVLVSLKNIHSTFSPSSDFLSRISDIMNWFVPSINLADPSAPLITAPPRPTYTVYIVRIRDCVVEWKSVKEMFSDSFVSSSAITVENLELCSGITSTVDASKTFSGISVYDVKCGLWLAKQVWSNTDCFNATKLKEHGYRQILTVCGGSAVVKSKDKKFLVELELGSVRCDLKPDSFVGLVSFATCLIDLLRRNMASPSEPSTVFVNQPPIVVPFHFSINENFLQEKTRGGRGGSRFSADQGIPEPPQPQLGTARWLVDPSTVSVVYDHLTIGGKSKVNFAKRKAEEIVDSNSNVSLLSVSALIDSVRVYFVDGSDWTGNEFHLIGLGTQAARQSSSNPSLVCLEFDQMSVDLVSTSSTFHAPDLIFRDLTVTASEVRIRDGVVGSVYQSVVCPMILEDDSSPGDFFHVHYWSTGVDDSLITKGEISVQPLSVSIDQDTLDFMQKFIRETTVAGVEEQELDESREEESGTVNEELPNSTSTNSLTTSPLFQSLLISPISLELNYRSKRLSLSRLRHGDVLEFLNLVPMIEGVRLCLREVRLVDVPDSSELGKRLTALWSQDTRKSKIMKSISHVTPVRSFTNLTIGVKELINQPRKQMRRKDGNLGRGILRGVSMFVKTLTIESLNLIDSVVSSAQGALEFAGGSSSPTRVPSFDEDDGVGEGEDEVLEWTSVEKGARERELDPSSAIEGLYSGSDALIRGVRTTIRGDSGVSGFILKPAIGATQAVSVVLRGARSTLDSGKHRAETERKYKAPYTRDEMLGN